MVMAISVNGMPLITITENLPILVIYFPYSVIVMQ